MPPIPPIIPQPHIRGPIDAPNPIPTPHSSPQPHSSPLPDPHPLCAPQTCEAAFATKDRLRAHAVRHEDKVPCHVCGKLLSAAYIGDHMKVHGHGPTHVCGLCNKGGAPGCGGGCGAGGGGMWGWDGRGWGWG